VTARLVLRELGPDDAAFAHALNADPEVLRYTGDPPFSSVEDARAFLERYDDYRRHGMGRWGAALKPNGELVGWCGLKRHVDTGEVDLGFRFARRAWGRGLATEAAAACLRHGFEALGLDRIVGRAMEANAASHRVLEKIGLRLVGRFVEGGATWRLYDIRADAAPALTPARPRRGPG
jgi:RimJ/RimL family protein N-acetyltransferase